MNKEIISNNFNLIVNKLADIPPVLVGKEVVSNAFNLIINKGDIIPPEQLESLEGALKDYTTKLEHIRKCIQIANEKISCNVFDLKTHEDIFNKLTNNGEKKAIIMENGELYINATYLKSGLIEGCILRTSPNGEGQHVYVEGDMYSIKDGNDVKAMFGFKSPITGQKSNTPFLAIGHDGVGESHNYLAGVSYPAKYNPIGSDAAYAEWAYQFVKDNYTSIRFNSNGEIEINPDYRVSIGRYYQAGKRRELASIFEKYQFVKDNYTSIRFNSNGEIEINPDYRVSIGRYYQAGKRRELASIFEKNGNGCFGTYLVEAVNVLTEYLRAQSTLYLESNNGEVGLVLYGGSQKAFQPNDNLSGQVQLGTPWGAWKSVFATNTYSSDGVVTSSARAVVEEEITTDNVIDNIEFINTNTRTTELQMDVTKLKDTKFVETSDKTEDVFINESELLKLALFEIKKLKEEIKAKVGVVTKLKDTKFVETSDKTEDVFINESELLKLALFEIKKLKEEIKAKVGV